MRADAQLFTHDNYSLSTAPATKTLPYSCTSILIENMDAAISALISFDAGATYKTLKAGHTFAMDVDGLKSYIIKSASATPSVEALYASEA